MALEYLPGGDMSEWLKREGARARGEDLIFLLHQVACGMTELAQRGIGKFRVAGGQNLWVNWRVMKVDDCD